MPVLLRSGVALGGELRLSGWRPAFAKVRFTKLLEANGYSLADAIRTTGRLLDDEGVTVRLPQLGTAEEARAVLEEMGVVRVEEA